MSSKNIINITIIVLILTFNLESCETGDIEFRYFKSKLYCKIIDQKGNVFDNAKIIILKNQSSDNCFDYSNISDTLYTNKNGYFLFSPRAIAQRINFSKGCKFINGKIINDTILLKIVSKNNNIYKKKENISWFLDGLNVNDSLKMNKIMQLNGYPHIIKLTNNNLVE